MKNSSKFVLIVAAVVTALIIVMMLMFRGIVTDHLVVGDGSGSRFGDKLENKVSEDYDIDGFSRILVAGGWDVLVIADEQYRVTADFSEDTRDYLKVRRNGDTLVLQIDYEKSGKVSDFHGASATIHMPVLNEVRVEGAVNLNIEDFNLDSLDFILDGAGQIIAENCSVDKLGIESNGAVNVDFYDSETRAADVNIDGAGNVMLNMTGGELSGLLSGLAHLEYTGSVSRMTVEEDGIANVEYKKDGGHH